MTVFGFQPHDKNIVLMEFAKCGDIKEIGSGRDDAVNWMHLKYAVRMHATACLLLIMLNSAEEHSPLGAGE